MLLGGSGIILVVLEPPMFGVINGQIVDIELVSQADGFITVQVERGLRSGGAINEAFFSKKTFTAVVGDRQFSAFIASLVPCPFTYGVKPRIELELGVRSEPKPYRHPFIPSP
jgi:hypothetical protein